MDEALLGIVKDRINPIDYEALMRHTRRYDYQEITPEQWKQVRHLHVFQRSWEKKNDHGCYISPDGYWVLIHNMPSEMVYFGIAKCGERLELLNIIGRAGLRIDVSLNRNLKSLRLDAGNYGTPHYLTGIGLLTQLEELSLRSVLLDQELDLSQMNGLKKLKLQIIEPSSVTGIEHLRELEELILWLVSWGNRLDLSLFPKLKSLSINAPEPSSVSNLSALTNLASLHISGGWSGSELDLSAHKKLKELGIMNNRRTLRQIDGLSHLTELEDLMFHNMDILRIPEDIRRLKKIRTMRLIDLQLDELPDWLPELGLPFSYNYGGRVGIFLEGTSVKDVNMSIFDQPQDVILQWFEERRRGKAVPLNEVKVVFLGDGEAGKTHTIARLLNDGEKPTEENFDGKATPGIVIRNKEYELDGKNIQIHFWDFGGQEILHSMHRMFLTERTLYVVLINARDDTQNERARYWLHNIKSFAGTAPVLLVLNKIDQNPNATIAKTDLQRMYAGLKDVVSMSALEYSPEQFNAVFTGALLDQVRQLGTLGTLWPASWLKLKTGLETMKSHYIHGGEYEDMCESCGVEKSREELLNWFNDLGVSFCYGGSARLEDYVILRPEWLTNAIYILLFNKCEETRNGIIPHRAIHRMLHPKKADRDKYRRVLRDVVYDVQETDYVLDVVRKFRLSYKVSERAEFIPALCQRESMPAAQEYADDPDTLEFRMTYEYLPENVIHRLMVEMRQDLDNQTVWRTGARFVQYGTGLSAVVSSEGNVLRIFVRRENTLHLPNTYLHMLKGNIDQINRDLKLEPPFCEVIYKADGITEAFDYEDLLFAWREGEETYRSKDRRRSKRYLPIQDILNQSGRTAELELDKLRAELITACMKLQGNSRFWDASEDERNTYVRDLLRSAGYKVSDQTFQGISGGEKRAGELDLDIRTDENVPWTICEALRIRDKSKPVWNAHLEKLLDNYNPSGLNYLFLLTYVDCDKDRFPDIWNDFAEHIRWYDPGEYERMPSSFSHIGLGPHNDPNYIRAVKCKYDRAGSPTTVCHIFVRMGR